MVACLNGLSSAQLAAAHPVSGGTYEYGYRWLHPSLGFTAGWMFLCARKAHRLPQQHLDLPLWAEAMGWDYPHLQVPIGLGAIVLVALFVLAGIRWSSLFNSIVVSITMSALALFVVAGFATLLPSSKGPSEAIGVAPPPIDVTIGGFLEACALMFVAYTGYGRIATLGEEIRDPKRNIPIAIITTLAVSTALYVSVAWVSIAVAAQNFLERDQVAAAPLEIVAQQFTRPEARYVIAIGAVTSMMGVLINLVLGLSRVALAMGRRGDLPRSFARLDESGRTAPHRCDRCQRINRSFDCDW